MFDNVWYAQDYYIDLLYSFIQRIIDPMNNTIYSTLNDRFLNLL